MKKYLLLLVAVMMTTLTFAQGRQSKNFDVLSAPKMVTAEKMLAPRNTPSMRPFVKGVKAPQCMNARALKKVKAPKNPRRAPLVIDDVQGDFVFVHYLYEMDEEYNLNPLDEPEAVASAGTIEVTGANTISISGLTSTSTKAVTATVNLEDSTFVIAGGQVLEVDDQYGDITMMSVTSDGTISGKIYEGNVIYFDDIWADVIMYEGQPSLWSGFLCGTVGQLPNATMEYSSDEKQINENVFIEKNEDSYTYTVYNFAGYVVDINVAYDKTFAVDEYKCVLDYGENYGMFYPAGMTADGKDFAEFVGKGTETTLTSDVSWTFYSDAGYSMGLYGPFTITLEDGEFLYPEKETGEVVTIPAGMDLKEIDYSAVIFAGTDKTQYAAKIKYGQAGNDFFFQGLDKDLPEAWAKGTLDAEEGIISIPVTYMGEAEGVPHFLGAYGENGPDTIMIAYTKGEEGETFEYNYTIQIYKATSGEAYVYYMRNFLLGQEYVIEVNEQMASTAFDAQLAGQYVPADAQTQADIVSVNKTVKVVTFEDYMFIKGIFDAFPDSWVMGITHDVAMSETSDEKTKVLYIFSNQLLGTAIDKWNAYFVGYLDYSADMPLMLAYDEATRTYTSQNMCMVSRIKSGTDIYGYYSAGMTLTLPEEAAINTIEAVKQQKNVWYTIGGQRVAQPAKKGLYIHNGKKVVVK